MQRFPFSQAVGDLKLGILTKILVRDAYKFLHTNHELRHYILSRGPFHRKRFKRLHFTFTPQKFTEDSMIGDLLHLQDQETGARDVSLSVGLGEEAGAKFFDVHMSLDLALSCIEYFFHVMKDEAFYCENVLFSVCKGGSWCRWAMIKCTIPLSVMSTTMQAVRSYDISYCWSSTRADDWELSHEIIRRFHPNVTESFAVTSSICMEAMLGTHLGQRFTEIIEKMLQQCSYIKMSCHESLIPRILTKLMSLKTLIIVCGRLEFVDTAKKLVEEATYHRIDEVLVIGTHSHDHLVFETALVQFEDEAITAIKNHRRFRELIDAYKRLQARMNPLAPAPRWTNREENKVLVQWTNDQAHAFLLQQGTDDCVYFYTRFE